MTLRRKPFRLTSGVARAPRTGCITGHNILTYSDNGSSQVRVTTALPHGLAGTETIVLGDPVYGGGYDGGASEFLVISARVFDLPGAAFISNRTGGRWD